MDGDDDSTNEDIETIDNRPLVPAGAVSTAVAGSLGGGANEATSDNNDDSSSSPEQSIPLHPLLFILLNNTFMRTGDESSAAATDIKQPLDYLKQLTTSPKEIVHDTRAIQSLIEINDIFRKNKDKINVIIEVKLKSFFLVKLKIFPKMIFKILFNKNPWS